MARWKFQGTTKDQSGRILPSATISVYLAGTTTPASVYTSVTSTTAVNSVTSSSTDATYAFYTDSFDYDHDQAFKIIITKSNYTSVTYDNLPHGEVVLGTYTISTAKTVTTYVKVPKGVVYTKSGSGSLTFNGPFEAGLYQVFSGFDAGDVTFGLGATNEVSPKWWGALGDGVADDSIPFQSALDTYVTVKVPQGPYLINCIADGVSVIGSGNDRTILKSYSANGYALTLKYTSLYPAFASPGAFREIKDIKFIGDTYPGATTKGGIDFYDEFSSGWLIHQNYFFHCNKGINKGSGSIRNRIINNYFSVGNYGYYASVSALAHIGCDLIEGNEFNGQALTGIYLDNTGTSSSTGNDLINMNIFEGMAGISVFVKYWNLSYTPLKLSNNWFENTNSGNVTINGTSYTVRDLYFEDTAFAIIESSGLYTIELVNSRVHENGCTYTNDSTVAIDSTSVLTASRVHTYFGKPNRLIDSYGGGSGIGGSNADVLLISPRKKMVRGYTSAGGPSFSNADSYDFNGTTAITVPDGILFDSCAELIIPATETIVSTAGVSIVTDKWYVWSIDLKLMTTSSLAAVNITGAGTLAQGLQQAFVKDKWVTVGGITNAVSTFTGYLYIYGHATDPVTLRLSAWQTVQFNTQQDAIEYFNNGLHLADSGNQRVVYSTSAPTTGTWAVGDRVINKNATIGQPKAWSCTVAGTSGTWVSEGNL